MSGTGLRHHPREIYRFVFVATDPGGGLVGSQLDAAGGSNAPP